MSDQTHKGNKKGLFRLGPKKDKKISVANIRKFTVAQVNAKKMGQLDAEKGITLKKTPFFWFLDEDTLYYSVSQNEQVPKGEVPLSTWNKISVIDEEKFIFEIASAEKQIWLRADSKASMTSWVSKLTQVAKSCQGNDLYITGRSRTEHNAYVKVWSAKDLVNCSDTYITILADGAELARSNIFWNSKDPHYQAEWNLEINKDAQEMAVEVRDVSSKGSVVGIVRIPLKDKLIKPSTDENDCDNTISSNKIDEAPSWYPVLKPLSNDACIHLEISTFITKYLISDNLYGTKDGLKISVIKVSQMPVKSIYVVGTQYSDSKTNTTVVQHRSSDSNSQWKASETNWSFEYLEDNRIQFDVYDAQTNEFLAYTTISNSDLKGLSEKVSSLSIKLKPSEVGRLRIDLRYTMSIILSDNSYDKLFALLIDNKMELIKSFMSVMEKKPSRIAENLVRVCERRRVAVGMIKEILEYQIQITNDPNVIFRSNTLATKSFDLYMKLIALPHLHKMLSTIITDIYKGKKGCELDPTREDPKRTKKNFKNLVDYADQVLVSINKSLEYLPLSLRSIFEHLKLKLADRWPDNNSVVYSGISGFFFLRFVCPAILGPTLFGIASDHGSVTVARDLMIIAKTLQTLANLTKFTHKEEFMLPVNDWITSQQSHIKSFLDKLAVVPSNPIDELPTPHTQLNFGKEMAAIVQFIDDNFDQIKEILSTKKELFVKLESVMSALKKSSENSVKTTPRRKLANADTYLTRTVTNQDTNKNKNRSDTTTKHSRDRSIGLPRSNSSPTKERARLDEDELSLTEKSSEDEEPKEEGSIEYSDMSDTNSVATQD
eukprot:TRINITY_DN229_c0_g2_i1.p1 TRINITY_DN229_c0_g2~~TRINITY_DN229_c0_g2_i1.p1  ORF type:complete len:840 (+),score=128.45 TRINITY_DN229_c0_g2_i1:31-2520(+)